MVDLKIRKSTAQTCFQHCEELPIRSPFGAVVLREGCGHACPFAGHACNPTRRRLLQAVQAARQHTSLFRERKFATANASLVPPPDRIDGSSPRSWPGTPRSLDLQIYDLRPLRIDGSGRRSRGTDFKSELKHQP